jgi:hypothetical protein
MAGAGYDVSASTARSLASGGAENFSPVIIAFSGSSINGGNATLSTRADAESAATNRSPGASSVFASEHPSGVTNQAKPKSGLLIGLLVIAAVLLLRK